MSLSDFSKNYQNKNNNKNVEKNNYDQDKKEDLLNKYNNIKDMSQQELMEELLKEVHAQKSTGQFDYDSLEKSVESLGYYLSEDQKNNLKFLLNKIK